MKKYLEPASICLPDFSRVDGTKWAAIAVDQFSSEPKYWHEAYDFVGNSPSTLKIILPEVFLSESKKRIPEINRTMDKYLESELVCHENAMIYLERKQSDGRARRGIVAAIDLEDYDFNKGSQSLTRATEGTVIERIPPRVEIRRDSSIELPHILVLIDDPKRTVVEKIAEKAHTYKKAYEFELMLGGGSVCAHFVDESDFDLINSALSALATPEEMQEKYGINCSPLLYAIGDGNHSLATAKTVYEELKAELGEDALKHPARYALCEIVNIYDEAIDFEPIYRVMFGVEPRSFQDELEDYCNSLNGEADGQSFECVSGEKSRTVIAKKPVAQLPVGTLQEFIDKYLLEHREASVDYVHGEDSTRELAKAENTVGILFEGMTKEMLFKTVICDGALPRKTFSMGLARDKRYYIECRKIK